MQCAQASAITEMDDFLSVCEQSHIRAMALGSNIITCSLWLCSLMLSLIMVLGGVEREAPGKSFELRAWLMINSLRPSAPMCVMMIPVTSLGESPQLTVYPNLTLQHSSW